MSYTPQPGTIPHRVIEFLKQQPRGVEFSSAHLAEAIGHDGASIAIYLAAALEHGVLKGEKRVPPLGGQKTYFWSLGDGTPLPKPDDYVPDEPLKPRNASMPAAPAPAPAAPPAAADTVVKRKEPDSAAPEPVPPSPAGSAVFGWFSDGSMTIRNSGQEMALSPAATHDLVKFIDRVRHD